MAQAENSISLILADSLSGESGMRASQSDFAQLFSLKTSRGVSPQSGVTLISEEAVGRGILRRLEFFADAAQIPYLIAPLLIRELWKRDEAGSLVIAYPGVSWQRLVAARDMLNESCEAVLLRRHDATSIVIGLIRNRRNERIVAHWADCVERFSADSEQQEQFDPNIGSSIINYLCDRVGTLKYLEQEPVAPKIIYPVPKVQGAQVGRNEIRKLLPKFQQLFDDPVKNAVQVLNMPTPEVYQDSGNLITYFMSVIWSERADLQTAFDLSTSDGRRNFVDWFLSRASLEHAVTDEFLAPIRSERTTPSRVAAPGERRSDSPVDPFAGVNLIGYPRAEMGMGEQLRGCAAALSTTDLDVGIREFNFGIIASHQDNSYEHLIRADNPFNVNLFHINADQMPLAWDKLGPEFFRDHYNIAYWEWELSNFPDEWQTSIDLVDEIWAPSRFIQEAISKKTTKPVIWMPLAIEFPLPAQQGGNERIRSRFGLPDRAYLFLFTFDFSSFSARKNFVACIDAFQHAFPEGDENVGLVLKTNRRQHHMRQFWQLLEAIGDDRRIHVVDRVLRQKEMRELIASCDSFVSLHRSEGFGLGIAEAMYLGKPVIATNYSGNVDFSKKDNSCPVDYELIAVKAGEYPYGEGQVWADPNVHQAATYMQHLVADHEYAQQIGMAASSFMRQQHSWKAIGNRYSSRVKQIASAKALLASEQAGGLDKYSGDLPNQGFLKSLVKRLL